LQAIAAGSYFTTDCNIQEKDEPNGLEKSCTPFWRTKPAASWLFEEKKSISKKKV
jgi:hypothetical protein